jgi:hypothetical protein
MSARNIKAIARVEEGKGMESVGMPRSNPRQRKTRDVWVVQGNYGYGHGWEDLTAEETFKEIRQRVKEYRENEPGVPFRVKLTRERIGAESNPKAKSKYMVMTSFGGKVVSSHRTLADAKKSAKRYARTIPVDVWSTSGGHFGQGEVVEHYYENRPNPEAEKRQWRPQRRGDYWYVSLYRGKVRLGGVPEPFVSRATALKHANYLNIEQRHATANPAGPSAIPAKWTSATVSRKGGQIQIRMGGR